MDVLRCELSILKSFIYFIILCALLSSGETQYNRDKLLQGMYMCMLTSNVCCWPFQSVDDFFFLTCVGQGIDTPLSDTGHLQAAAAGRYLKDLHFTDVFVSNLQRAVQVCETATVFIFLSESPLK